MGAWLTFNNFKLTFYILQWHTFNVANDLITSLFLHFRHFCLQISDLKLEGHPFFPFNLQIKLESFHSFDVVYARFTAKFFPLFSLLFQSVNLFALLSDFALLSFELLLKLQDQVIFELIFSSRLKSTLRSLLELLGEFIVRLTFSFESLFSLVCLFSQISRE